MVLALYGTGGAGKETLNTVDAIQSKYNRWREIIYIDDTKEEGYTLGHKRLPYVSFHEAYPASDTEIHITQGEPTYKSMLVEKVSKDGYKLATLIHPAAIVDHNVSIGQGVQIKMGAHVYSNCVLEDGVWIQAYATVRESVHVRPFSQVSAKCYVGRDVQIGDHSFIGMHANVAEGVKIGSYAVISMGAVLLKDVGDEEVFMGNPARKIGNNQKHFIF